VIDGCSPPTRKAPKKRLGPRSIVAPACCSTGLTHARWALVIPVGVERT